MKVETAMKMINDELIFIPGWKFTARDHRNRFQDSIILRIDYPAQNSNRDQVTGENAENPYPESIMTYAEFPMIIADGCTTDDLFGYVGDCIMKIQEHEMREFLRIKGTGWAPFHPHHTDGMIRWESRHHNATPAMMSDLQFGIA
jgi:hypothetical protein